MKAPQTTHIIVVLKSVLSNHKFAIVRPRSPEKMAITKFDPNVQKFALYKEDKNRKNLKP